MNLACLCARLKPVFLSKKGPSKARLLTKMSSSEELGTLMISVGSKTTQVVLGGSAGKGGLAALSNSVSLCVFCKTCKPINFLKQNSQMYELIVCVTPQQKSRKALPLPTYVSLGSNHCNMF